MILYIILHSTYTYNIFTISRLLTLLFLTHTLTEKTYYAEYKNLNLERSMTNEYNIHRTPVFNKPLISSYYFLRFLSFTIINQYYPVVFPTSTRQLTHFYSA